MYSCGAAHTAAMGGGAPAAAGGGAYAVAPRANSPAGIGPKASWACWGTACCPGSSWPATAGPPLVTAAGAEAATGAGCPEVGAPTMSTQCCRTWKVPDVAPVSLQRCRCPAAALAQMCNPLCPASQGDFSTASSKCWSCRSHYHRHRCLHVTPTCIAASCLRATPSKPDHIATPFCACSLRNLHELHAIDQASQNFQRGLVGRYARDQCFMYTSNLMSKMRAHPAPMARPFCWLRDCSRSTRPAQHPISSASSHASDPKAPGDQRAHITCGACGKMTRLQYNSNVSV